MRLERITMNKIKIFLTHDDLKERGMSKEDLWIDGPKVQELFREMMIEANDELGFKADGSVAVEVFALPAQGMVIIVTKNEDDTDFDDEYEDGYIELKVTLDESDEIFFEFSTFEDVIGLASRLYPFGVTGGTLYSFSNKFFLMFDEYDITGVDEDALIALLSEFGNPATLTSYRVIEYGKILMEMEAVFKIYHLFIKGK